MHEVLIKENYSLPVQKLFELGEPTDNWDNWDNYLDLGIGTEHFEDLFKIVENSNDFFNCSLEDELAQNYEYAPIYAWRILAQLKQKEIIYLLVKLLIADPDDDWLREDLGTLIKTLGPDSIPQVDELLSNYIFDLDFDTQNNICSNLAEGLQKIGLLYPNFKAECIKILEKHLSNYQKQGSLINAYICHELIELNSTESIDLIRNVFAERNEFGSPIHADEEHAGDLHNLELLLGLREKDTEYLNLENERKRRWEERHRSHRLIYENRLKKIRHLVNFEKSLERKKQKKVNVKKKQKAARKRNR
jgi:hypothetical protein